MSNRQFFNYPRNGRGGGSARGSGRASNSVLIRAGNDPPTIGAGGGGGDGGGGRQRQPSEYDSLTMAGYGYGPSGGGRQPTEYDSLTMAGYGYGPNQQKYSADNAITAAAARDRDVGGFFGAGVSNSGSGGIDQNVSTSVSNISSGMSDVFRRNLPGIPRQTPGPESFLESSRTGGRFAAVSSVDRMMRGAEDGSGFGDASDSARMMGVGSTQRGESWLSGSAFSSGDNSNSNVGIGSYKHLQRFAGMPTNEPYDYDAAAQRQLQQQMQLDTSKPPPSLPYQSQQIQGEHTDTWSPFNRQMQAERNDTWSPFNRNAGQQQQQQQQQQSSLAAATAAAQALLGAMGGAANFIVEANNAATANNYNNYNSSQYQQSTDARMDVTGNLSSGVRKRAADISDDMLDEIRGDKSRHLAGIDGGKTDDYNRFGGSVRDRDSRDAGQFRSSSSYYNSPPVAKRAAPSPLISAKTPVKQTAQQQQPQQRQPQQSPLPKRTEPLSSFGYSERSFIAEKLKKAVGMVDVNQELWIETRLGSKSGRAPYYYNANTLQVRHTAPSPKRATVISQDDLIFSLDQLQPPPILVRPFISAENEKKDALTDAPFVNEQQLRRYFTRFGQFFSAVVRSHDDFTVGGSRHEIFVRMRNSDGHLKALNKPVHFINNVRVRLVPATARLFVSRLPTQKDLSFKEVFAHFRKEMESRFGDQCVLFDGYRPQLDEKTILKQFLILSFTTKSMVNKGASERVVEQFARIADLDFNGVSICCAQMPRFRPPKLAITETVAADKANNNRGMMKTNIDDAKNIDDDIEVLDTEGEVNAQQRAESKSTNNKVTFGNKRFSGGEEKKMSPLQAKKGDEPLIKAGSGQKEEEDSDVIVIEVGDPKSEWKCIQTMINTYFEEMKNKLRASDNKSKSRAFLSIQAEIRGAMEFFAQMALDEAKDPDFKQKQKAKTDEKYSLLDELNSEFLKLSEVKVRIYLSVQSQVAELCDRVVESVNMMLQEKAESQTLQTAGSGTKTKSGKKPAELDRTVIADDLDDADAEEKGKGVNEMLNDATTTTEESGKKNVDCGDKLNTIGNDGENDDKQDDELKTASPTQPDADDFVMLDETPTDNAAADGAMTEGDVTK